MLKYICIHVFFKNNSNVFAHDTCHRNSLSPNVTYIQHQKPYKMKTSVKYQVLFLVLMILFTPLAFILMPVVAALIALGAVALLLMSWLMDQHHHA